MKTKVFALLTTLAVFVVLAIMGAPQASAQAVYGSIFGTIMVVALAGGAAGPLVTGVLHDLTGNYTLAFAIGIAMSGLSAAAVWLASPRKVRSVAGRLQRISG